MRQVFSVKHCALSAALAVAAHLQPCAAQTVIRDTTPPPRTDSAKAGTTPNSRGATDSAGKPVKADTASKPVAPAPEPAANLLPKGVCADGEPGPSADVLLVTFRARSEAADRQAAIKPLKGTLVALDPTDDDNWYVRFPSGGNEFLLRAMADRLIRAPIVKEVGPVQCPARQ